MLKTSSNTEIHTNHVSDDGVWDFKCWIAIALFGILLTISDTSRLLKQSGRSVSLLAGGAAAATFIHKREDGAEIAQLTHGLQSEQVAKSAEIEELEATQQHLLSELYAIAIAEASLFTETTQANTASQAKIEQAQARIAELEAALTEKTTLATEMLTELEAGATSTFNQFNAKIAAQDELINHLYRQIESLRTTNTELTAQQTKELFASIGTASLQSHHLLRK